MEDVFFSGSDSLRVIKIVNVELSKILLLIELSICIPVFKQNISSLAGELFRQRSALGAKARVQLVVMDDGSEEGYKAKNRWLQSEKDTIYKELEKNIGRAAIRNRLAEEASGQFLLFLDDDSRIIREVFLKTYLEAARESTVICGGREYSHELADPSFSLHHHYGKTKESRSAAERDRNPYAAFHSNNFLVPKKLLQNVPFDESLNHYGHEDTLFGFHLKRENVPVRHIDNPILHADLETNDEFLKKSRLALENLKTLYERKEAGFDEMVKILRAYRKLKSTGMRAPMAALFRTKRHNWEKHLLSAQEPSMRIFNLYKLGYLCSL